MAEIDLDLTPNPIITPIACETSGEISLNEDVLGNQCVLMGWKKKNQPFHPTAWEISREIMSREISRNEGASRS